MEKSVCALIVTLIAGLLGIYVGAMLNLEGYSGNITAIAVMGYYIIQTIEDNK